LKAKTGAQHIETCTEGKKKKGEFYRKGEGELRFEKINYDGGLMQEKKGREELWRGGRGGWGKTSRTQYMDGMFGSPSQIHGLEDSERFYSRGDQREGVMSH